MTDSPDPAPSIDPPHTGPKTMPGETSSPSGMDFVDHVIDATLALAAEQPWAAINLDAIADRVGVPTTTIYRLFPNRSAVLDALARRIDIRMLEEADTTTDSARDRLFDAIMTRLDALTPHKEAVRSIMKSAWRDPFGLIWSASQAFSSMEKTLEAAGIIQGGPLGQVRAKVLGGIYLATLRIWLDDDNQDLGKTMAYLDRQLNRVEQWSTPFASGLNVFS